MTMTRKLLDTEYIWWFHNKRNTEQAKQEKGNGQRIGEHQNRQGQLNNTAQSKISNTEREQAENHHICFIAEGVGENLHKGFCTGSDQTDSRL